MKLLQIFLHCSLTFLSKTFDSLFDTVFGWYGILCDDVGWWSGFNKGRDGVDKVDIGIGVIMEGTGTNNQVYPTYRASTVYLVILVYGVGIL